MPLPGTINVKHVMATPCYPLPTAAHLMDCKGGAAELTVLGRGLVDLACASADNLLPCCVITGTGRPGGLPYIVVAAACQAVLQAADILAMSLRKAFWEGNGVASHLVLAQWLAVVSG